ncbi:MAG: LysM peptidoglycan-binding domain-containing protein [Candidatus Acidiferrales bacterium]
MRRAAKIGILMAAGVVFLAGCDETVSSKQAKAHIPAATPAPAPAFRHEPLPFPTNRADYAALSPAPRPAIDILIVKIQAAFDAGQKEYLAGNLEQARDYFDSAEDLIVASGFQVDSDPRLSKLFDKIGDAMENYERDADKGAEEEPENSDEPAAIDELANLTLPAGDPRLATKAENELIHVPHDLPLTVNDSVLQYLSYFSTARGRATVEHGLERAGRYDAMIRRVLHEEGVPEDLIYLAQAESAFQPAAVSRAGARGLWQFMPFRGEEYDLDRNYWVDERSDPEKATRAAARHMRDLYDMFGDWYLVMAAYNSGPLNVIRAVERTGYADFWDLQRLHALPKQTQNYVPIIIALALVGKDPALYGVQVQPEKPAPFDSVALAHSIDLHLVADASGADLDDLRDLNPELLRGTTPNDPNFELKLPPGAAAKFKDNIAQVPEDKWTSWRLHTVEDGESLGDVARHYRVSLAALDSANHLDAHAAVPAGFLLNIPTAPPAVRLVHYRVQRGDTLEGIADRFDVTVAQLRRWNHLGGNRAPRGSHLRIYAGGSEPGAARHVAPASSETSKPVALAGADPVHHRVQRGETLYSIAHAYKITVETIRQSNPFLSERPLEAGDLLVIDR